ncbi:eCIS core domain-containing protein [Actinophytocola xanthii]|uniref:eCIS core domain-containing protein n=1 Tax=Actinophytocola xanthii TaxID=1912961 RepID=A0A1Q8CNX1_9PSEU|nr:DUF4157 domain-containing protein [Actinophytocola xanthii]OLF16057.1 hypothetical protein BU204_18645 [Actinophytocola xanthii]
MRWPFRRKGAAAPANPSTSDVAPAVAAGAQAPVARPSGRQWLTLPPLPVTVNRPAPLVTGPPPVLPPLPGHRSVSGPAVAPAMGRVEGLAKVVPHVPEPAAAPASPLPEPVRPLVHRRRVRGGPPGTGPAAMVEATGGYVGEAREPAVPHRAPGWMRYVPEWLNQGTQSDPEPARPAPRAETAPKPVLPPSKVVERPTTPVATQAPSTVEKPPLPERPARRPSLGQSRRLGLGAPLKHPEEQPAAESVSPPSVPEPVAAPRVSEPSAPAGQDPGDRETGDRETGDRETGDRDTGDRDTGDDDAEGEPPPAPPPAPPPRPALRHPRPDPAPVPPTPAAPVTPRSAPPVTPQPVTRREVPAAAVPLTYRSSPGRQRPRPVVPATPARTAQPPRRVAGYVPADLASALRGPHQVDVSSIPVHRGPEVSAEARSLGARAFARGGEVYLPDEAGPLDTPKARGLLAHELVHAVQQRTLGPTLPAVHTPAGAALEAAAVAVEHAHSGHSGHAHAEPAPLLHPSLTQVISQAARTVGVQLAPLVASEPVVPPTVAPLLPPTPPAPPVPDAVTPAPLAPPVRDEIDLIAEASAIRTLEEWTAPTAEEEALAIEAASAPSGFAEPSAGGFDPLSVADLPLPPELPLGHQRQDQELAAQVMQVMNVERASNGQQPLTTLDAETMSLIQRMVAEQTEAAATRAVIFGQAAASGAAQAEPPAPAPTQSTQPETAPAAPVAAQPVQQIEALLPPPAPVLVPAPPPAPETTSTDPSDRPIEVERLDLDQLAARIYDRLRTRIRMELLIDRERAGLLTDFR